MCMSLRRLHHPPMCQAGVGFRQTRLVDDQLYYRSASGLRKMGRQGRRAAAVGSW